MEWVLFLWLLSGRRRVTLETAAERNERYATEARLLAAAMPWVIGIAFVVGLLLLPSLLQVADACAQRESAPPWIAITEIIAGC